MKSNTFKRFLSAVMALLMLIALLPVGALTVEAATGDVVDTAVFFSDLHTKKSDYKESTLKNVMSRLKSSGMSVSSVTSAGDAFSVNEDSSGSNGPYTGYTSTLTGYIQSVLGNVPVNYVWSDHDRYAVEADGSTSLNKTSRLVYGAGNDGVYGTDDDANYYIYSLSMGDLCSYDRYSAGFNTDNGNSRSAKGFTATVEQAVANFSAAAANLKKDRPLFIASHQPLFDNRNDNAFAELWFDAINEVAKEMDVAYFYGHNHKYDTGNDYYYAKGSTMPVTTTNGWNGYQTGSGYQYTKGDPKPVNKVLNFSHMCAGYLAPSSTGSTSSTTREGTLVAVTIYEDSISYVTYNAGGVYTGKYALNVSVPRAFAGSDDVTDPEVTEPEVTEPEVTEPEVTEPEVTEPEATEPAPTEPTAPEVPEIENEWVALPSGNTFVLDTDGVDSGAKYLIVAESYAKALSAASSKNNGTSITISGSEATADADLGWTITASGSNYTIQKDGTYLNRSSSSLASGSSSSTWTVSSQGSGKYNVTQSGGSSWWGSSSSYYLRWSNSNNYFQASSSNKNPVRLYKQTGSASGIDANYIRLAGETVQTYTTADAATVNTVLGKIKVQTSNDGINANTATIAVSADMVSWNKAFDGSAANTYVGTVTCEGLDLGTVTVTVNAIEHDFETVTVDATCTEDGSITTKCTICGEETVEVIPATGHDYKCVETGATCGAEGSKVFTCGNCADTYTEVIPATGKHTYASVTVDATCTEAGSVTYTCKTCGHSYTEAIAALGHSYESATVAPTCTDKGHTTYTCATCNHSYTDGITDALGHSYSSVITATCETSGYVVYTCDTCGHSYNGEVVPAYGHSYETTTVAPTCATAGYTTYICSSCGHTYTGNEIAALGHDYDAVITEATCTENGFTTYTCATCGHSYVADEILALGHDYESVITAPTFETEGYTTHTCKVCGDVKVDSYVPVLKHTYETVTVDATCETDGYVTHTCVTCGYSYTETLPALGHAYTTVTTEATCTVNGSIVSTCATCGNVVSEVIKATGHDFDVTTIDPTCTDKGFTTYTCSCGHVETTEIAVLGHQYASKHTAPTCTEAGGTTYTCSVCGHSYTDVEAALGHSYDANSVAPTCTDKGYTTYTCTTCGDSYTGNEVAALGHSNTAVVTEPTCTDKGYTTYTCTVCAHTSTGNETAALGHAYSTQESDGNLVHTCDRCGHSYSEKLEMTYTKVSSIQGDNNYVITLVSGNKYYAVSHKDNKISATQITVSNNEITSDITEDLVWTYSDNKLSYEDGDTTYYLYAQSAGGWWGWWGTPTLTLSATSSSDVSFSNSKFKVGSYYLRYSNSTVSLNRSATTTYCFIEE